MDSQFMPLWKQLLPNVGSSGICVGDKLWQVDSVMYFSRTAISRTFIGFFIQNEQKMEFSAAFRIGGSHPRSWC
jgi:hypothetical protein